MTIQEEWRMALAKALAAASAPMTEKLSALAKKKYHPDIELLLLEIYPEMDRFGITLFPMTENFDEFYEPDEKNLVTSSLNVIDSVVFMPRFDLFENPDYEENFAELQEIQELAIVQWIRTCYTASDFQKTDMVKYVHLNGFPEVHSLDGHLSFSPESLFGMTSYY